MTNALCDHDKVCYVSYCRKEIILLILFFKNTFLAATMFQVLFATPSVLKPSFVFACNRISVKSKYILAMQREYGKHSNLLINSTTKNSRMKLALNNQLWHRCYYHVNACDILR